jgi:hypothetical protein
MTHKALLIFSDDGAPLDPKTLSEFLSLLKACVVASDDLSLSGASLHDVESARLRLHHVTPLEWNHYFRADAGDLVYIDRLSKQSPLEMVLVCSVALVTLAVILSGGEIECSTDSFKAKLPPLGKGIMLLKEALGLSGQIQAGFSIQTIVIKLSKKEQDLLLQQDPTQKGKGGFQNFLVKLQSRLNRQTRELTLGDQELERIMRYKASPKKGGFQSRFKKIFGRHFP